MFEMYTGGAVRLQFIFPLLFIVVLLFPCGGSCTQITDVAERKTQIRTDSIFIGIKEQLDRSLARKDFRNAGVFYMQMAEILFNEGAIVQALEYYLKAYSLFRQENDLANLAKTQNQIGIIHFKSKRYSLALKYFKQSLNIFKKVEDKNGIADTYSSIGTAYLRQDLRDSASYFFKLALVEIKGLQTGKETVEGYENIAKIYEDLGDFSQALRNYLSAQKLYGETDITVHAGLLNNIGDIYRKTGNFRTALTYSKSAEQQAFKMHDVRELSSAHRDLAKTYSSLGKYDSAYHYSEKARYSYAEIFNQENNEQLYLLQTLFEIQQKDSEITSLENERNRNRILSLSMIAIGILGGFLAFSVISRQRLKLDNERRIHQSEQKSMQLELNNKHLLQESLKDELELKSRELTSHTLHIIQKNQFLEMLKNEIARIIKDDKRDQRKELKQVIGLINTSSNLDTKWEDFRVVFENVHRDFFEKLNQHSSSLTATDLRFLALLKMNLSSPDIATMLGVSPDSLRTTRYRIRKKLQLQEEASLHSFIQGI